MCEDAASSPVAEGLEAMSLRHARRAAKCFRQVNDCCSPSGCSWEFDRRAVCEEGRAGGRGGCIRWRSHTRLPGA